MQRRKKVTDLVLTQLLVDCKRRCCLCVGLNSDFGVKQLQVAHLDHDPQNGKLENLAALCLQHHDEFDTRRSQSKGLTKAEIVHYKETLKDIWQKSDKEILLKTNSSRETRVHSANAQILGEILTAFDSQWIGLEKGEVSNGLKLLHLGKVAIEVHGDFTAGLEAELSLMKLANEARVQLYGASYSESTANALTAAVKLIVFFAKTDQNLLRQSLSRLSLLALAGDMEFEGLSSSDVPGKYFKTIVDILWHSTGILYRARCRWACNLICERFTELLLGIGMSLVQRGIALPATPTVIYINCSGERVAVPESSDSIEFVYLANLMAKLADENFECTIKKCVYRYPIFNPGVAGENSQTFDELLPLAKRWALLPGFAMVLVTIASEADKIKTLQLIQKFNAEGKSVAQHIINYLAAERRLIEKGNAAK